MFEAYITNTALYPLMGIEVGTTVHFPMTTQELQAALAKIGIDGKRYSEVFFTSFDSDVLGLYDHLYECENIDELNELGHALLEVRDKGGLETFEAALVLGNHTRSVKDLINLTQNLDLYRFYPDISDDEGLGRLYADELGTIDIPEHIQNYFDYEAYGRDVRINEGGVFAPGGYVSAVPEGFKEYYHGPQDIPPEHRIFAYPEKAEPVHSILATLKRFQEVRLRASMARSMKEVHTINYYPINEGAARRAKEMNSFSDYKEGSATAEYRAMVDKAAAIAEKQKSRVDPMYHEKIDHLLDTYARKLAENMNQGFAIDARVPSVMIAGPANFPVGKKEKQNRARDNNMEEWRYIQGLLDKIRSTGMGGISADDPAAIEKLQKKLDGLERSQFIMKEVNTYYRKHGKLDGCALLSPDQIEKLKASMASSWRSDPRPFESYQLTNNNAEIRRVKARIEQLSKQAQQEFSGWEFDGGRVEMNREDNRLQVFFDGKPDADTRAELKSSGFRWAPSVGAWQRQLTDNAIRAADRLECIKPLSGEKPSQLQKKPSILQTMREQGEKVQTEPEKKAPSGRDAER